MDIYLDELIYPHGSTTENTSTNATDNYFKIICVTEGEFTYTVFGHSHTIPEGNYAILDNSAEYDVNDSQVIQILFKADVLNKTNTEITTIHQLYNDFISKSGYTVAEKSVYRHFNFENISERINFIISEAKHKNLGYEKCIKGALCEIIAMTIRNISVTDRTDKSMESIIERITLEISKHYNENIQLSQFAEELGYSISYLSECFKSYTGNTFSDYLKKIRMKIAHKLIIEKPEMSIEDIARNVGYTDIKFFASAFKKAIGITPKEDIDIIKESRKLNCPPFQPKSHS